MFVRCYSCPFSNDSLNLPLIFLFFRRHISRSIVRLTLSAAFRSIFVCVTCVWEWEWEERGGWVARMCPHDKDIVFFAIFNHCFTTCSMSRVIAWHNIFHVCSKQTDKRTDGQADKQTSKQANKQTSNKQTSKQADMQQTDKQTSNKQTSKQADMQQTDRKPSMIISNLAFRTSVICTWKSHTLVANITFSLSLYHSFTSKYPQI
jgi:hypothetical protein